MIFDGCDAIADLSVPAEDAGRWPSVPRIRVPRWRSNLCALDTFSVLLALVLAACVLEQAGPLGVHIANLQAGMVCGDAERVSQVQTAVEDLLPHMVAMFCMKAKDKAGWKKGQFVAITILWEFLLVGNPSLCIRPSWAQSDCTCGALRKVLTNCCMATIAIKIYLDGFSVTTESIEALMAESCARRVHSCGLCQVCKGSSTVCAWRYAYEELPPILWLEVWYHKDLDRGMRASSLHISKALIFGGVAYRLHGVIIAKDNHFVCYVKPCIDHPAIPQGMWYYYDGMCSEGLVRVGPMLCIRAEHTSFIDKLVYVRQS